MRLLDSRTAARAVSLAIAGLTVLACGQLAGIDDAPIVDDGTVTPGNNEPDDKPGGTVDERNDSSIVITPEELDFGAVPCGNTSLAKLIVIQNKGSKATTYNVALPANPSFAIKGALTGPLPADSTVTLEATAKPAVANDNTADLVITAGGAVKSLKPKVRGMGASLEFVPALWNFGEVRRNTESAVVPLEIFNRGNAPAVISGFKGLVNFVVTGPALPATIEGDNAKVTIQAKMTAGLDSPNVIQEIMELETASTMCAAVPTLSLKGKRVNADVLISTGEWGRVSCNQSPSTKDITITNYSTSTLGYTAALPATTAFTIVSGMTGTVPAGNGTVASTQKIVVRPKNYSTALGTTAETLTVTFTSANPGPMPPPLNAALSIDYRGALIALDPPLLQFTSDGVTKATKTFTSKNNGNEPMYFSWYIDRISGGPAWSTNPPFMLNPGQQTTTAVDFLPSTTGPSVAKLGADRAPFTAAPCRPITPIDLQGTRP